MHDSAYRLGELVMRTYSDLPNASILEIGSMNVNGCLRDAATPTTRYVGLDLEKGPSVDKVIKQHGVFPVKDGTFDLVMASSVFEHDPRFWDTFLAMCRAAKVGGHIYINAPSNGTIHRYPLDCWRFYPDAGLALADHARASGMEIDLVESFVARRHSDVWNDFVAIFRRGPSAEPMNTAFVYYRYPAMNARTWQSGVVYNGSADSEDIAIISDLRAKLADPQAEIDALRQELEGARSRTATLEADAEQERDGHEAQVRDLTQAREDAEARVRSAEQVGEAARTEQARVSDRLTEVEGALSAGAAARADLEGEVRRLQTVLDTTREAEGRARADLAGIADLNATLESNLRQRQEEAEQAWAEAARIRAEHDRLSASEGNLRIAAHRLEERLTKADGWVFQLAGERRTLERRLDRAMADARDARRAEAKAEEEAAQRFRHERRKDAMTIRHITEEKTALHGDIEALLDRAAAREQDVQALQGQIANMRAILESVRTNLTSLRSGADETHEKLDRLLAEREQELEEQALRLAWLHRLHEALPIGASDELREKGVFDGAAYLSRYPDVADAGLDPLRHYLLYGMGEARKLYPEE